MNIFVLNAGSSSLKFRLFKANEREQVVLASGLLERWDTPRASLEVKIAGNEAKFRTVDVGSRREAAEHAVRDCMELGIDAVGHRIVHGGPNYRKTTLVTSEVLEGIRQVMELAPLHNVGAIAGIEAALNLLPRVPSIAAFDTAFHQTMPDVAAQYALPWQFAQDHALRRYGFHGISHQYLSQQWHALTGRPPSETRLITCHLGNGASVCAIRDGLSIDTSMGFTPMEGLVMGTRCGDIDPGLLLHLLNAMKKSGTEVEQLLNRQSGLLGLSGSSADMRDLERAAGAGGSRADLALEMFAYRVRKYIGAYAVALGGVDAIVFSGGIGEHSPSTRQRIAGELQCLGAVFDASRNAAAPAGPPVRIDASTSKVELWVIPTDEERQIARQAIQLLAADSALMGREMSSTGKTPPKVE